MSNSVESKAKQMVSGLDPENEEESLAAFDSAISLFERRADCVGCKLVSSKPEPRISTRTIAIGALLASLFLPPLIPLDDIIGTANAWRGPAVGFHSLEVMTPAVRMGQPLVIKTRFQYLMVCNWKWVLEWKTATGKPIAMSWHWGSAHVAGVVGGHEMPMELPKGITPGNYIFVESATGECDHGMIGQVPHEEVAFAVTD